MNLVLATLSFFGAVFLPGAILYKLFYRRFNIDLNISSVIIGSFVFSIGVNFILIYILVLCKIYTQNVVVGILLLEIILFLYLYRYEIKNGIQIPHLLQSDNNVLKILFFIGILISLYVFSHIFKSNIFFDWDAVVSWDRWGGEWAKGVFVFNEYGYPQLYPMLLSLGYVASQKISSFQGIGVAIYFYFAFVGILTSIFLFNKDSIRWSIFGIILSLLTYVVFFKLTNQFYVGYVDMPVAMLILISALCLLKVSIVESSTNKHIVFYLILGALAAGISVEVKQSGLFWCVVYIIGLFYLKILHPKMINFKIIFICIAIILLFSFPWLFIAIYKKIILNTDATNSSYVMESIFLGKGYLDRFLDSTSKYKIFTLLFLLSLFSLKIPNKIFGFFAIFGFLYFIFWATHLSYSLRNVQGGLPLMLISLSGVIVYYLSFIEKILIFLYKKITIIFVCFVLLGLVVVYFSQDKILQREYKQKMTLGDKDANELVLETFKNRGNKLIVTNNQLLAFVPAFDRDYYRLYHFEYTKDGAFEKYANELKKQEGSFYILLPKNDLKRYEEFLKEKIILGKSPGYILIEF